MKIVNALRDCNLLIFCGYPRDMADRPCRERAMPCSTESIQFVSAPVSERRVLRVVVLTFPGTQQCFVGRYFCTD